MRQHSVRPSSAPRNGRQHNTAGGARLPSFWGVCLVILSAATTINLYTFNHRRTKHTQEKARNVESTDATQEEPLQVGVKQFAGTMPKTAKRENDGLDDKSRWVPNKTHENIPLDGSAEVSSSDPTADTANSGAEDYDRWPKRSRDPRPLLPLPLGRDRPVEVLVQEQQASSDGAPMTDGERFRWPAGDEEEEEEESTAVKSFPCSLSEADDFLGLRSPSGGEGGKSGGRVDVDQMKKPWSTEGPCVIACSSPLEKGDVFNGQADGHLRGGGRGDATGEGDGFGRLFHDSRYDYCDRAFRACALYQECTHILLPPEGSPGEEELSSASRSTGKETAQSEKQPRTGGFATLMHRSRQDGSMASVQAAASALQAGGEGGGWKGRGGDGFTLDARARTYYVVSFGGSGSKMLGGWLSERGKSLVKEVFHIHDPRPADTLFAKQAKRGVSAGRKGRGKDFRGYDFPEGDFPTEGTAVRDVDSYRVVFIFKDPAEALVSRYFYNHCKNLRGADCGDSEQAFPTLDRYAQESQDRLHMETFYDKYCSPGSTDNKRNYPVVCVNYHKMWDNKEALVTALGLPVEEASKLPVRTETVRNDQTSAARQEPFTLAMREQLRRKQASLSEKVFQAPAVAII